MEQGHKCIKLGERQITPKDLMDHKKKPLALGAEFYFFPCGFGCEVK